MANLALATLTILASGVSLVTSCQPGWVNYNEEKCLKYFPVNVNHSGAVSLCTTNNASLASVHSADEQDFILAMGRQVYSMSGVHWVWLGANRVAPTQKAFAWDDRSNFTYNNWRDGCPDARTGEDCVLMTIFRDRPSHWCNFKCDSNYDHVVCQKSFTNETDQNGVEPEATSEKPARRYPPRVWPTRSPGLSLWTPVTRPPFRRTTTKNPARPTVRPQTDYCDLGWDYFGGKCYKFVGENITGEEAAPRCRRYGASILTIESEPENTWAVDFALEAHQSNEAVWLSGRRVGSGQGDFVWKMNGRIVPMNYSNWADHEPDNRSGQEFCVAMNDMSEYYGRWMDTPCTIKFHLVCEKKAKMDYNEVEAEGPGEGKEVMAKYDPKDRMDDADAEASRSGDGSEVPTAKSHVLLNLLLITMSLIVGALLMIVYNQRQRLGHLVNNGRHRLSYRRRTPSSGAPLEPEYAEPHDARLRTAPPGPPTAHARSDSAMLIWTNDNNNRA
ncbi:Neurocan core protein [Halotydeus destructor]|nr:Neurocan core protein [Halotydeus destructor]